MKQIQGKKQEGNWSGQREDGIWVIRASNKPSKSVT